MLRDKRVYPFGHIGYRYDDISSTYFAQAREYNPKNGRFTAEDIIKGNGLIPETLNSYVYCWNSPMGLVDLDGKKAVNVFLNYNASILPVEKWVNAFSDYIEEAQEVYKMQREKNPAPTMPDDGKGLPDYTEEIDFWLMEKTEDFKEKRRMRAIGIFSPPLLLINEIDLILNFYNEVKTGGPMDIKEQEAWDAAFDVEKVPYFIYHGEIIDPGTLGNITYGYAGAALYPDFMLYYGGGFANMKNSGNKYIPSILFLPNYGDAPEDIEAIRKGIDMWNERNECIDE